MTKIPVSSVLHELALLCDSAEPSAEDWFELAFRYGTLVIYLNHDDTLAVDAWAKLLGLPVPVLSDRVLSSDRCRPFREYETKGTWRGWPVHVWCSQGVEQP